MKLYAYIIQPNNDINETSNLPFLRVAMINKILKWKIKK